jgi:hypothetical protein
MVHHMARDGSRGGKYRHVLGTRVSDGTKEAIQAVKKKEQLGDEAQAVRRMLTAGALKILGEDWRPSSTGGPGV